MDFDEIYNKKTEELLERIAETSYEQKKMYHSYGAEGKEIILNKIESYGNSYISVFKNVQYDIDKKHAEGKGEDEQEYVFFKHSVNNYEPYQREFSLEKNDIKLRVLICGNKQGYNKALFEFVRKNAPAITSLGYSFNGEEIEKIAETFRPHIVVITVTLNDDSNCAAIKNVIQLYPGIRMIAVLGSDIMQGQVKRAGACQVFSRFDPFSKILDFVYATYKNYGFIDCVRPAISENPVNGDFIIEKHNNFFVNPLNKFIGWFHKSILH